MDAAGRSDDGPDEIRVWDAVVRLFHWGSVLLVASLVASAHFGMREAHLQLGADFAALLALRLLWGFAGPGHARFASFVASPRAALGYLRDIARGRARRFLGHNPAGGLMVIALLGVLVALAASGFALQATLEFEGPLVDLLRPLDDGAVAALRAVHGACVNALYVLVPLHVAGVALASVQHRENLVRAMLTGCKRAQALAHER